MKGPPSKAMHPILIGHFNVPMGTTGLVFAPANGLKLTHMLAWGAQPGALVRQIKVADEPQIITPLSLRMYESLIPTSDLRDMGAMVALAKGNEGPVFFHLRNISPDNAEKLRASGRDVYLSTVLPGWGVDIELDGPVCALAFFGYEAS
jgi:hypothetical protein